MEKFVIVYPLSDLCGNFAYTYEMRWGEKVYLLLLSLL